MSARAAEPPPAATDEEKEIDIEALKQLALNRIAAIVKRDSSGRGFLRLTKSFSEFVQTAQANEFVVATIFYVTSALALREEQSDIQQAINDSARASLSVLYSRLLLSPVVSDLGVREDRMFFETLIFFLEACCCFAVADNQHPEVYRLVGALYRGGGVQDPNARQPMEFLKIAEIVRRNWLSQRVPGKSRAEGSAGALRANTPLISATVALSQPAAGITLPLHANALTRAQLAGEL